MKRQAFIYGTVSMAAGLITGGLLQGCGGGNNSDDGAIDRKQQDVFRLTLSTTKTVFARGEEIPLALTLTNTGREAVTVYTNKVPNQPADFSLDGEILELRGETVIWF